MEEKERAREVFEEVFFKPMEKVLGPFLNEEARQHLSQARVEVLKAMRSFIDAEIERVADKTEKKTSEP
ncbi:MAG TPA: hypothetical protein PKN31_03855 [Candidatus Atribacteria bacterium]|nr:hypothetical protein [Candidatus Atribacteria bacterium]